jgi:hypothetical protein
MELQIITLSKVNHKNKVNHKEQRSYAFSNMWKTDPKDKSIQQ